MKNNAVHNANVLKVDIAIVSTVKSLQLHIAMHQNASELMKGAGRPNHSTR